MVRILAACLVVMAAVCCGGKTPAAPTPSHPSHLLPAGASQLRVDRAWTYGTGAGAGVTKPSDEIPDASYIRTSSGATYTLTWPAQGSAISIVSGSNTTTSTFTTPDGHVFTTTVTVSAGIPITGTLVSETPDLMTFTLSGGTFAGGRLVVWHTDLGLQGELTIYGSGVPITQSERGTVTPL